MKKLIEKFPNGRKLYLESPIFKRIINTMYSGGLSEYQSIEHLINIIESKQKEDIEALENARNIMDGNIPEAPKIGTKENPFLCSIEIARNMKKSYSDEFWVCVSNGDRMRACQLKEIK